MAWMRITSAQDGSLSFSFESVYSGWSISTYLCLVSCIRTFRDNSGSNIVIKSWDSSPCCRCQLTVMDSFYPCFWFSCMTVILSGSVLVGFVSMSWAGLLSRRPKVKWKVLLSSFSSFFYMETFCFGQVSLTIVCLKDISRTDHRVSAPVCSLLPDFFFFLVYSSFHEPLSLVGCFLVYFWNFRLWRML